MFYSKVLEIIVHILNELKSMKEFNEIDFNELENNGYTSSEINTALAWIYSKVNSGSDYTEDKLEKSDSPRLFNYVEKRILTTEALGYLIWLSETGIIGKMDREAIIDKIILTDYSKIDLNSLKSIIAIYLLDIKDVNDIKTRLILENNESYN